MSQPLITVRELMKMYTVGGVEVSRSSKHQRARGRAVPCAQGARRLDGPFRTGTTIAGRAEYGP